MTDFWSPARLATLAGILTCCLVVPASLAANGVLEVHFLDVGQGDCTFISCPDGETVLVDCGTSQGGDGALVRKYLQKVLGSTSVDLDTLVVTHPDQDHYNLLPEVIGNDEVGQIFIVGKRAEYKIQAARDWLFARSDRFVRRNSAYYDEPGFPNPEIACGAAEVYVAAWDVKAKGANKNKSNHKVNARSIVLVFVLGDFDVVLTGDATFDTEDAIRNRYGTWIKSEVLKAGHHGSSATSTSPAWASAVSPELVFVSADDEPIYGHPRQDIIQRLEAFTVAAPAHQLRWWTSESDHDDDASYERGIYSTATNGNMVLLSNGSAPPVIRIDVPFD